ncbi:MAG: isoprenyl transferase [Desulfobacterales bacterium]|nr:isoprenyl transferase [Desulfobacterales bacterium]
MPDTSAIDPNIVPRHVAIIMDGNGRWARQRGLPRVMGHKVGSESVKEIIRAAKEMGISFLTLYAFSTENWQRPALEVKALMGLLKSYLLDGLANLKENRISLRALGRIDGLPPDVRKILYRTIDETAEAAGIDPALTLNLALNYGARAEIVEAVRQLAGKCRRGELVPDQISEEMISAHLYTRGQPDPDLIIRTGGESRLSNFLLWQGSYAEFYITETKWPDFRRDSLIAAILDFQNRERRFGKTGGQVRPDNR